MAKIVSYSDKKNDKDDKKLGVAHTILTKNLRDTL